MSIKSFQEDMTIRGIDFTITSYYDVYKGKWKTGEVDTIQIQMSFKEIYSQNMLDWNYYPKSFVLLDIKTNPIHDKLRWNKKSFDIFTNKLQHHLEKNGLIEELTKRPSGGNLLDIVYQLDHVQYDSTYQGFYPLEKPHNRWHKDCTREEAEKKKQTNLHS